jgi:hypothetical protein
MAFLPILTAVATIGGAVLSGVGVYNTAQGNAQASSYNAKQQDIAVAADRDAAAATAEDARRRGSAARASALADRGASGVALSGTPLLVDEDTFAAMELDAARIGQRGAVSATQRENQAKLDLASAAGYRRAGPVSAGASLLGGLSSVKWG